MCQELSEQVVRLAPQLPGRQRVVRRIDSEVLTGLQRHEIRLDGLGMGACPLVQKEEVLVREHDSPCGREVRSSAVLSGDTRN